MKHKTGMSEKILCGKDKNQKTVKEGSKKTENID